MNTLFYLKNILVEFISFIDDIGCLSQCFVGFYSYLSSSGKWRLVLSVMFFHPLPELWNVISNQKVYSVSSFTGPVTSPAPTVVASRSVGSDPAPGMVYDLKLICVAS